MMCFHLTRSKAKEWKFLTLFRAYCFVSILPGSVLSLSIRSNLVLRVNVSTRKLERYSINCSKVMAWMMREMVVVLPVPGEAKATTVGGACLDW